MMRVRSGDLIRTISNNTTRDRTMKKLLTLCAVALVAGSVYAAHYPDITITDLKAAMASKSVTLLDANGTDSYKEGHIPGAINFESSRSELAKVLPKDKNALVVAYCGGPPGHGLQTAAKAAEKVGYKNRKQFKTGIFGWAANGEKKGEERGPITPDCFLK